MNIYNSLKMTFFNIIPFINSLVISFIWLEYLSGFNKNNTIVFYGEIFEQMVFSSFVIMVSLVLVLKIYNDGILLVRKSCDLDVNDYEFYFDKIGDYFKNIKLYLITLILISFVIIISCVIMRINNYSLYSNNHLYNYLLFSELFFMNLSFFSYLRLKRLL